MTQSVINNPARGIIQGKTLQEWMDAPAGAFAEAVRKSGVDPMFGLREQGDPDAKERTFEVEIEYRWRGSATKTYTVTACTTEEAEVEAKARFQSDSNLECDDVDDWEISNVEEVR